MLLSLFKIIVFIVLVAAIALGAGWLMEVDGGIRVAIANLEFNLGPLQAVIAAVLLLVAVWAALRLFSFLVAFLRFLNGDETAISRYFSRNRERRGYKTLSEAMIALASGEGQLAMSKAERAERTLHRPDLTNLIVAQAAELTGDTKKAEAVYKRLLSDDSTRFVGVRGLMLQKLSAGDTDTAMKLAEKAFALRPKHAETQDVLLKLQAQTGDWTGARKTLGAKLKSGTLPRDVYRRRDAVLALGKARSIMEDGATIEAREAAIEANRLSPGLVPAAAAAARHYAANQQARYATRVIKKAWDIAPHPDLAAAFAEIVPDETPAQRLRRFQTLTAAHPDDPQTKMLLAELNIAAEDFPSARRALGDLATEHPTARALTIMAAIERGEGAADVVVRGWLAKALVAPRGPQWVCDNCHSVEGSWAPTCSNCGAFDTLTWREAPSAEIALPAGTEMLPLIIGSVEDQTIPVVQQDVVDTTTPLVPEAEIVDDTVEAEPDPQRS